MKTMKILTVLLLCKFAAVLCERNILILGGNGLLGSATVQALVNSTSEPQFNITLLNRGNWYWDTEVTIKPYVTHIKCERGDYFQDECPIKNSSTYYEAILDFSSYHPLDIEDILVVLEGRFKYYIYISTDSVYEVCDVSNNSGYNKEEDAVRPANQTLSDDLSAKDPYGNNKLKGEETLEKFHDALNYKYISLRLPDVIGPRDNTLRFWKYYLWCKLNNITGPIHIPPHLSNKTLSLVYSSDVAELILSLLVHSNRSEMWNNAYNLGFQNDITLKGFLKSIGSFLNEELVFDETERADINFGIPSVLNGPISSDKAKKMLQWEPTDLDIAVKEICKFYESAQYVDKNKFILDQILDSLHIRRDKYRRFLDLHLSREEL